MERAGNGSAKIDGCPRQNPAYRPDCTQNRRAPTHSVGTRRFPRIKSPPGERKP